MKTSKKLIASILALVLILCVAACGQQATPAGESTPGAASPAQSEQQKQEQKGDDTKADVVVSYPMKTDKSFTLWTDKGNDAIAACYSDATESPYHIGLEKNTGVKVEYILPDISAGAAQAFNLMMNDSTLPDLINANISVGDASMLLDEGVIWDLTDYIPTYAPDYWEFLNRPGNEVLLKSVKDDNGRIFGAGTFRESFYNVVYIGPVIRQDWLDECGLKAPVTLEDWENVLITFKEKYNAPFGFTLDRFSTGLSSGTGAYAAFFYGEYVDDNGKIQCANVQPEWKELLETLHKWYEMGLIDQDSFTIHDDAVRTKAINNEIGVSFTAMSQLTNFVSDAEAQGTGAKWVGFEYPRTAPGAPTSMIAAGNLNMGKYTMITKELTEEEMIIALEWLNYGFTEEGMMYNNFGTEGETYTINANGEVEFTSLITDDPDGLNEAVKKYTICHSAPFSGVQLQRHVQLKNTQESVDAVYKWIDNTDVGKHYVPGIALSSEESAAYSDKVSPIKTYVNEMALKFVTGEEDLANFDAFVKTLQNMGLDECLALRQAAYDRYISR